MKIRIVDQTMIMLNAEYNFSTETPFLKLGKHLACFFPHFFIVKDSLKPMNQAP